MQSYPYTCLEQRVSRAVALEDEALWSATMSALPAFVDRDGTRTGTPGGLLDVVDAPGPTATTVDDATRRPNQLLAASLPDGPLAGDATAARAVVAATGPLVTPLGPRSLAPGSPGYLGRHRGPPAERDRAYHQGTVWPWLIGPYVGALRAAGRPEDGVLDGLLAQLGEAGLGSVGETADGDPPHGPTGCPFQAWSVAELLRVLTPGRPGGSRAGAAGTAPHTPAGPTD
jgi:glycogen debranching enzyme